MITTVAVCFQLWNKESLSGIEEQIIVTDLLFCDTNVICMLLCHLRAKGYSENEAVILKADIVSTPGWKIPKHL